MTIKQKLIQGAKERNYHEPLIIEAIKEFWDYDYSYEDIEQDIDLFYEDIMLAYQEFWDYKKAYQKAWFNN